MMNVLAFPLGGPEIAVIFVVVLLLFGAKKIPELARGLGKSMGEFKKARTEFEDEIKRAEQAVDEEQEEEETKKTKNDQDKKPAGSEPKDDA